MAPQTFAVGVIGLIVGLAFGVLLGYGVTFETIRAFLTGPATYGWASAVGATGAAFVALGMGWFQNMKTRQLWELSIKEDERRRRRDNIPKAMNAMSVIELLKNHVSNYRTLVKFTDYSYQSIQSIIRVTEESAPIEQSKVFDVASLVPEIFPSIVDYFQALTDADVHLKTGMILHYPGEMLEHLGRARGHLNDAEKTLNDVYFQHTPHHSPSNNGTSAAG